ncbi:hypothetical protein [uncultured Limosilactobacillus sp.]|uniref:hypothetical protein n=1 Tax=uncultured Limosilactobacillus sp. TaxID=2837629 RepID=UPI0025D7C7C8|nr:hypothetical protein [uncultured Limosilactobacillus sp.]
MQQNNKAIKQGLADQTSKLTDAVSDARDIGFNDGLGDRVDALAQKYDGLETNINLRERKMDAKTQQYIAKLADLDQVGRYLERYTKTVNDNLVPTLRQLIYRFKGGLTIHTSQVTSDVYQQLQQDTGLSVDQIIATVVSQQFKQDRKDAQEASLGAKLAAKASQKSADQLSQDMGNCVKCLAGLLVEFLIALSVVLAVPGWWKLGGALVMTLVSGVLDYYYLKKGGLS